MVVQPNDLVNLLNKTPVQKKKILTQQLSTKADFSKCSDRDQGHQVACIHPQQVVLVFSIH